MFVSDISLSLSLSLSASLSHHMHAGCLAQYSSLSQSNLLEAEVSAAFSNLASKHSDRRIAGCVVLKALAISGE